MYCCVKEVALVAKRESKISSFSHPGRAQEFFRRATGCVQVRSIETGPGRENQCLNRGQNRNFAILPTGSIFNSTRRISNPMATRTIRLAWLLLVPFQLTVLVDFPVSYRAGRQPYGPE